MALDASQTLDILFDEDNGLLTGELDIYGKTKIETLNFNDLDLLSDDFFSLLQQDGIHNMNTVMKDSKLHTHQIHSDHDYYAHLSPGQHSDSGVSVNSAEDFCNQTNMSEDRLEFSPTDQSMSSPPESDSPANSSPLGLDNLEEFDFSTFMNYGDTDNVNGVDISSDLTDFKDTDVSIDFDLNKLSKENIDSQLEQQQLIKNLNGQPAIILMDNKSQHVLRVQRLSSHSSSGDSLPFTLKDIDTHLSVHLSEPSGQFHELRLTDEEKELLAKEGVSLPTHMPLTKEEERTLKSVRRKIRNKVSAKESRKRKQTYMDGLEKRVKICTQENQQLQKKVENLEKQNTSLLVQLKRLQTLVTGSKGHAQASTCVMVLLLSFALLVLPNMLPFGKDESSAISADGGIRVKSRSLLANPDDKAVRMDFPSSLHSEDPYGVSSKPAPPWESKPPMTFSQLKTATQTGPLTSVETDEAGVNETEEAHKKSFLRVGENDLPLENKAEVRQGGSEKTVQDTQSSLDDKGQNQEAGVSSVNDSEL